MTKKIIAIVAIVAALFLFSQELKGLLPGRDASKNCNHEYYLSEYSMPERNRNGYSLYTCKYCGASYKDVIPATAEASDPQADSEEDDGSYSKSSRSIRLFALPKYSGDANVEYCDDRTDSAGYRHKDCYKLACQDKYYEYARYDLDGKYSRVSGSIYQLEGNYGTLWLEFYDGDEFLYSTARLTEENKSVDFSFDITGVRYLTVYPKTDYMFHGCWMIADQILLEK